MKFIFHSLFLKIFLWFWTTVIATGIALILTFVSQRSAVPARWHQMMENAAHYLGRAAIAELERGGSRAISSYARQSAGDPLPPACLFDTSGAAIAGEQCAAFRGMAERVAASGNSDFAMSFGVSRAAMILRGSTGRQYIFATELPSGPRASFGADGFSFVREWGVAFLVSGLICYFLARYLTAPILQLREASQRLARGDLGTHAAPGMEHRRDELGLLVGDFNAMADRIEELISGQRQLIYDVSHELRSPLARLNVALDLVRQRKGNDPALDHMEQDLECLAEMAGRLLTVARLDTSPEIVQFSPVNLAELVSRIVCDAEFESRRCDGEIKLTAERPYWVQGNAELLHSAIENVVRNAIRYTDAGTAVDVRLELNLTPGARTVQLIVRDYGPGIPEPELSNIFRPFYRANNARDRGSGGVGLGLAIAERVVRLHHGTISAENAVPQGLQIRIHLPEQPLNVSRWVCA